MDSPSWFVSLSTPLACNPSVLGFSTRQWPCTPRTSLRLIRNTAGHSLARLCIAIALEACESLLTKPEYSYLVNISVEIFSSLRYHSNEQQQQPNLFDVAPRGS